MNGQRKSLLDLMPSVYRLRDRESGRVLEGLLALLDGEIQSFEDHIQRLYENWFIETADEWVVPYVGDLLDAGALRPLPIVSLRAWVANTLRYRRRKGTAVVLEQLSQDVSDWPARAKEYFESLAWNQNLNHLRMQSPGLADLRSSADLGLLGGPFEPVPRTVDARPIAHDPGKYNIPNVGVHAWRLAPYTLEDVEARKTVDGWTIHPAGVESPLLNPRRTEPDIVHLAEEIDLPVLLRMEALRDEVEHLRERPSPGQPEPSAKWFAPKPVLKISTFDAAGSGTEVPAIKILVCDLSVRDLPSLPHRRPRPPETKTYFSPPATPPSESLPITLALDPTRGVITFPTGRDPAAMRVTFTYGFSADLGGGPYDRSLSVAKWLSRPVDFQVGVRRTTDPTDPNVVDTFDKAVSRWNHEQAEGTFGVIAIMDNGTYSLDPTQWGYPEIQVPRGGGLLVVAAKWPKEPTLEGDARIKGHLVAVDVRPHLKGDLVVLGAAPSDKSPAGDFVLDGVLLEGSLLVATGDLGALHVAHSTLLGRSGPGVDPLAGISCPDGNSGLSIDLQRSIVMGVEAVQAGGTLGITETILARAPGNGAAAKAANAASSLESVTVFGTVEVRQLEASNCIFLEPVTAIRRQQGCIRYSYLAEGSQVARRHRCQPDEAIKNLSADALKRREALRVRPSFSSMRYGSAAFAQLRTTAAREIREGAEDRAEMGAFRFLCQPQRRANLTDQVREYLPFGLEAGILEET